jgi:hypothetical protein
MPVAVRELRGSGRGIETAGTDGVLIFPNVLSCIAVAAYAGGTLAGAHVTVADQGNLERVREGLVSAVGGGTPTFYIAGPVDGYELGHFGDDVQVTRTEGGVDIRVKNVGGEIQISKRPAGSGGDLTETGFRPVTRGCGGCCIMM